MELLSLRQLRGVFLNEQCNSIPRVETRDSGKRVQQNDVSGERRWFDILEKTMPAKATSNLRQGLNFGMRETTAF